MSTSLRFRLIVFVIVPLAVTLAAGGLLIFRNYEDLLERRMEEDVELVARAVQLPLSRAVERSHEGVLQRALESVGQINRVFGLYVYDADGSLIATMGGDVPLEQPSDDDVADRSNERSRYTEVSGRRVYSYFVPLMDSGNRVIGLLQVTRRASDIEDAIADLRTRVGWLLMGGLLLVSGLVVVGHRMAVGDPLLKLRESMNRVRRGDRRHRADIDRPREIADVATTLNQMLDSLEHAETEIITRKETQSQLERQLKHAEKLAAIGQLAAGVAHELGTPLSVIDGKAQRALRNRTLDDGDRAAFEDIREQVARTEVVVRQLLDFGRRHSLNIRSAPPRTIARAAAHAVMDRARSAGTDVDVDVDASAGRIRVDALAIERVLTNLLENAIDAAPGGTVSIRFLERDGRHEFVVEDDGPGIRSDQRQVVLEPFFTTKEVGRGTGLGLSVAHSIAEEHGGSLTIGESPSGGTSVTVSLPSALPTNEQ
ncbi:MAG: ATP-binding protein [Bacteroidota bacterium]